MVAQIMERIMERMEHMDLKRVNIMECPKWECVGVLWQRDSVTRNIGAKSERNMVHDKSDITDGGWHYKNEHKWMLS